MMTEPLYMENPNAEPAQPSSLPRRRWAALGLPLALALLSAAAAVRYAGLVRNWDSRGFNSLPGAQGSAEGALFRLHAPQAQTVSLAGDFNGWKEQPLERDSQGIWEARFKLPPGEYRYVFHVDDEWILDPSVRKTARQGPLTVSQRTLP